MEPSFFIAKDLITEGALLRYQLILHVGYQLISLFHYFKPSPSQFSLQSLWFSHLLNFWLLQCLHLVIDHHPYRFITLEVHHSFWLCSKWVISHGRTCSKYQMPFLNFLCSMLYSEVLIPELYSRSRDHHRLHSFLSPNAFNIFAF